MSDPVPRLIASDLDGTLLGPDSALSPRTVAAVRAAREAGIEVVAATGRSHWSAVDRIRPADCIRWAICSNGATVWDDEVGAVVVERTLDPGLVEEVVAAVRRAHPDVGVSWETGRGVFETPDWNRNRRRLQPGVRLRSAATADTREAEHGAVRKVMLAHGEMGGYPWLEEVAPLLPAGVVAVTSSASFVEVTRSDATKGRALAQLCHELGVQADQTVAFGDHDNDISMLSWVGSGYAMAGSDHRILAVARGVVPPNGDDGVARSIEALVAGRVVPTVG